MSDRLTALDASFLHLEDGSSHMHVAGVSIFEGEAPSYDDFLGHIEQRLSLVPRFRQKLRFVPFSQGRPVWVDDPHFNLRYHVRATALPPPGSEEQLKNLASRVFAQQLDRTKPLWEIWLVEGLGRKDGASPSGENGEGQLDDPPPRFALLSKTHHALVDGVAGVDITAVLFDTAPEPETPTGVVHVGAAPRADLDAAARGRAGRARDPAGRDRSLRRSAFARRGSWSRRASTAWPRSARSPAPGWAPPTPLNVEIGPHRRFDWVRTDLDEIKQIKNALGGTVNDVVVAVVTGALREFLRSAASRSTRSP